MNTIASRIMLLIDNLGGNKSEFARSIDVTPAYISKLGKNPDSVPSDRIIKSICREFNVNEVWLRTGEGEMFNDISREEEIARFIGSLMKDSSESFKKSLILALSQLPETSWAVLEDFVNKIYDEYRNKDDP